MLKVEDFLPVLVQAKPLSTDIGRQQGDGNKQQRHQRKQAAVAANGQSDGHAANNAAAACTWYLPDHCLLFMQPRSAGVGPSVSLTLGKPSRDRCSEAMAREFLQKNNWLNFPNTTCAARLRLNASELLVLIAPAGQRSPVRIRLCPTLCNTTGLGPTSEI